MARIPETSLADQLVLRKFGRLEIESASFGEPAEEREKRLKVNERIAAFREEIASKAPEELEALRKEELGKQLAERLLRKQLAESKYFFAQPSAQADFVHWSKCAHWTLDEAIALSFGKAPEEVNWERIRPICQISEFAGAYARRRDLALRALAWKQLYDPVLPGIFLAWAKRLEIDVHPELTSNVTARGIQIADWPALFDQATKALKAITQERDALLARVSALEVQLAGATTGAPTEDRSLEPGERKTLDTLGAYFAKKCEYDPNAAKSDAPGKVRLLLESFGLSLNEKTIRKVMAAGLKRFTA